MRLRHPTPSGRWRPERFPTSVAQPFLLPNRGRAGAFTLIEIILAISLAIGILVVALFFHSQATNLRAQLLDESDRIAAIRLVMDRLTSELRHAFAHPRQSFTGEATSLQFVTIDAPWRATLTARSSSVRAAPRTDLKLVTYGLGKTLEGTNEVVTGLTRAERPLVAKPRSRTSLDAPAVPESTNAPAPGLEPMSEAIRFLRFRYWDGSSWSTSWDSQLLPRGVEITLGVAPLPEDSPLADYPGDVFRRVVHLPMSGEIDGTSASFDSTERAFSTTTTTTAGP